ncbi:biopolymer transport protein ExbB/TolQ [Weissella uvarum]|uniref:DNA/RNA non-specific endonuclease n=1 Tax=Weissella uvarum TaxID=1479233 RepID=UPI00195FABE9|nr:DNA/RNA non-specific endonuclease [Weissella uvarum]MBM7616622.1 biopolymer transport protein ExbB/TolQ [Weissella uvarum]MCM0594920.1 DNA/RNA non-specific endonuclease [Weissella uvarum]
MPKWFKKFLKRFNIFMVAVLVISTLGVLPSALTPKQVKAAEKVLDGRYQKNIGETEVYGQQNDQKPRYQKTTKVDYDRPGSSKKVAKPTTYGFWGFLKKTAKKIGRGIKKTVSRGYKAVKRFTAPIWKPIKRVVSNVWRPISRAVSNVWRPISRTVGNWGRKAASWGYNRTKAAKKAYKKWVAKKKAAKRKAEKKRKAKLRAKKKKKAKKSLTKFIKSFKKSLKKSTKKLRKSMNKQLSKVKKALKGIAKLGRKLGKSFAKNIKKAFGKQFKKIRNLQRRMTYLVKNAGKHSAKWIKNQLRSLKKIQKKIKKQIKKLVKRTNKIYKKTLKKAKQLKREAQRKHKKKGHKKKSPLRSLTNWLGKTAKKVGKKVVSTYHATKKWAKQNKKVLLDAADIAGDFIGAKDAWILVTGKDWRTGKKASRAQAAAWLVVGFTPAGKAAKAAKIAGKAVSKSGRLSKTLLKSKRGGSALRKGAKSGKRFKPKSKNGKTGKSKRNQAISRIKSRRAERNAPVKQGMLLVKQINPKTGQIKVFRIPGMLVKKQVKSGKTAAKKLTGKQGIKSTKKTPQSNIPKYKISKKPKPIAKVTKNSEGKTVRFVKNGEQIAKTGRNGRKELKVNIAYKTGKSGAEHTTDSLGRIDRVNLKELKWFSKDKRMKRNGHSQKVVGREDRLPGDHGGHLIGHQFGGSGDLDNLVAMSSNLNKSGGKWFEMEKEWAAAIKKGKKVTDIRISLTYRGKSQRPSSLKVTYKINGVKITQNFPNK